MPCAPSILGRPPSGPRWSHEIKHDGYRIIGRKEGDKVRIWTRAENEVGGHFVAIASALRPLAVTSATIDGEAVVRRPDGHEDFHALRGREGTATAQLVAYDLLQLDGDDLRRRPLEERCELLTPLCDGRTIVFSESLDVEGGDVFREVCALGLEGIVSKRKGSALNELDQDPKPAVPASACLDGIDVGWGALRRRNFRDYASPIPKFSAIFASSVMQRL